VAIDDAGGCFRFHAAVIRGVRVGPSPEWLRRRLEAVGSRSINNVVDATNCVMLELNQPMHAYDASLLRGGTVVARRGRAGETVITLDGVERKVTDDMTVIADAEGAVGIGGVMGGSGTEVSETTTDVVLECAWFEPARLRRTRRALGLATEASYRFERGVDLWGAAEPFRRCIELVLTLAGGTLAEAPVDLWPRQTHPPRIFLRLPRVAQLLGVELPPSAIEKYLVAIGATVVSKPEDHRIAVDVPGWRPDLQAEIDLIEEVARLHGYDEFPVELRRFRVGRAADAPVEIAADRVRRGLTSQGLYEVVTLPMGPADGEQSVRLLNPLSAEDGSLRRRLLPGLVRQAELNWSGRVRDVRLFEVGTVFRRLSAADRPDEATHVAGVITGGREPAHWSDTAPDVDRWDIKGLFEAAVALAAPGAEIEPDGDGWLARTSVGVVGEARPLEADAPPWAAPLFGFEVALDASPVRVRPIRPVPPTPSSERDVTLLVPEGIAARTIEASLRATGVNLLESVQVINEYRGAALGAGARSLTFRLTFRAPDRTLETAEVDRAEARLLGALDRETGVRRRDQASPAGSD
jgi:phenylalanyl-tRNA synthetase beta chain